MALGEYLGAGSDTTKLLCHLNGNANDSSGNGNNGTASNVSRVGGKMGGGAASLSGTSYISIPSQTYFNLQSSFTLSTWIYLTSYGKSTSYEGKIIAKDNVTTNNRCFIFMVRGPADSPNVGKLRFTYKVPSDTAILSTATVGLNGRHHIVLVSTQGTYAFYIDGVSSCFGSTNITPAYQGTAKLSIGGIPNDIYVESMIGKIDEVIIENRAWTATEVQKYYTYASGKFGIQ